MVEITFTLKYCIDSITDSYECLIGICIRKSHAKASWELFITKNSIAEV